MGTLGSINPRASVTDRNAASKTQNGGVVAAAPAATTDRWTYTVPSAKRALAEHIQALVQRETAAAPVGQLTATIDVTPSGGSRQTVLEARSFGNVANDRDKTVGGGISLATGDAMIGQDTDASTGGTTTRRTMAKISEGDA